MKKPWVTECFDLPHGNNRWRAIWNASTPGDPRRKAVYEKFATKTSEWLKLYYPAAKNFDDIFFRPSHFLAMIPKEPFYGNLNQVPGYGTKAIL